MKKFILSLILTFVMVFSASAQIATENSKFFDNTYIGVEGGVTTPLSFNPLFPVNPVAGLKFGKELTPVFALEAEGFVGFGENMYRYGIPSNIEENGPFNIREEGSINTFVKTTNVGLNGVVNLSNLLAGYKGTPRVFELKTNVGLGWLHYFGEYTRYYIIGGTKIAGYNNTVVAKTALDLSFNFGNQKQHSIVVTPGIYWNLSEAGDIKFDKNYAQFGVMIGYTYHFKTSNGTRHFKTYDVGAMSDEIGRLNDELAKKPTEVEVIKYVDRVVNNYNGPVTQAPLKETVYFAYDSDELDDRAKKTLDQLGENGIYVIDAYASSEGTTEYNKELSQRRADAVKAYLEACGARVDTATGHGVLFGTTTGRVAVITAK